MLPIHLEIRFCFTFRWPQIKIFAKVAKYFFLTHFKNKFYTEKEELKTTKEPI